MKILVCVAWPYAAGPRHLGHAVSTFIPADIVARYHRMKGDEVLMVGGSDMHGTPTMVLADQEGVTPRAVAERYHAMHEKNIEQLGVRYDLYWNTADPHHEAWVQEIFLSLRDKGHVYEATMVSPFCTTDQRFSRTATWRGRVRTAASRGPGAISARTAAGSSTPSS